MTNILNLFQARRGGVLYKVLSVFFFLLSAKGVWATCTGGNQTFTISMPATVSVPRDAAAGTLLTPWAYSAQNASPWQCSWSSPGLYGGRGIIGPNFSTPSGQTYFSGGIGYTVWNTNVSGVGIIVGTRVIFNTIGCTYNKGAWTGWASIMSSWAGVACLVTDTTPHSSPVGVQISVALVKTGQVPSGGIVGGTVAQIASIDVNTVTSLLDNVNITNVRIVPLLCTTPDVTVNMGTHRRDEFSGIGTFTSPIGFNIALNNCPAGMNSVSYRVDAVTTIVNASNSVVALDGSSTAAGVGVQLLDDTGSVFPLGTAKTMSGYSTGTGGSYAIPLKARYYQTGATVTAGTANSAMTFTMTYQ